MRATKIGFALFLAWMMGIASLPASAKQHSSQAAKKHSSSLRSHSSRSRGKKGRRSARGSWKRHGQQQIASDRVREIQAALVREHYLNGEPNGIWDQRTKAAMVKLQASQGWQTKVVPDSRALIKLGLGPNHEGALNLQAESDKTTAILKSADAQPVAPQQ